MDAARSRTRSAPRWEAENGHLPAEERRRRCRECGRAVPAGRRSWCSQGCVEAYRVRKDPAYARELLARRDRGVCALCGFDALEVERALEARRLELEAADHLERARRLRTGELRDPAPPRRRRLGKAERREVLGAFGLEAHAHRSSFWDVDHRVAVSEGGGDLGLANLRTLCLPCHHLQTRNLAWSLARDRGAPAPR